MYFSIRDTINDLLIAFQIAIWHFGFVSRTNKTFETVSQYYMQPAPGLGLVTLTLTLDLIPNHKCNPNPSEGISRSCFLELLHEDCADIVSTLMFWWQNPKRFLFWTYRAT